MLDKAAAVPGDYGWVAPTYQVDQRGIDAFTQITGGALNICEIKGGGKVPQYASICGGKSRCHFLSAAKPDPIRGYGFLGLAVDDAPFIKKTTWEYIIRPTIAQTMGWAILVGTPKGRNWFHSEHIKGQSAEHPDYDSFHFASNESPFFHQSEWDLLKAEMPDDVFRQEYMAEFLEDSAGVFKGINNCHTTSGMHCTCKGSMVVGIDLAKHVDYTVLIAICPRCGSCREMMRFHRLNWPIMKQRIVEFVLRHNGRAIIDATGVGDPIYDDLRSAGLSIDPVKFTEQRKAELIQGLMVAIEQRHITWPADWEVLNDELRVFEYQIAPISRRISYNAPDGFHDDCVIALALATSGIGNFIRPRLSIADGGESLQQEIRQLDQEIMSNPNLSDEEKAELLNRE